MRRLVRKGNLTVSIIFDLAKEATVFMYVLEKLQDAKEAGNIDSAHLEAKEEPYAREAHV